MEGGREGKATNCNMGHKEALIRSTFLYYTQLNTLFREYFNWIKIMQKSIIPMILYSQIWGEEAGGSA